ncbi:hypothetical protein KIW84_056302 [Lathyrus oleraceus]|uniref:3,4-dihydroxy-2-butanone-4-phosphate synthase n=1 Tax=Pisum sativum TaxID=3888 RepID=A0A9D4X000_PEA|nr:hypothetical protein KIW84_056302 [Pisum sativum]
MPLLSSRGRRSQRNKNIRTEGGTSNNKLSQSSEEDNGEAFGNGRFDALIAVVDALKGLDEAGARITANMESQLLEFEESVVDKAKAKEELGLPVDSREYGIVARILRDLDVQSMKLMTNNPSKYIGLKGYGLSDGGVLNLKKPKLEGESSSTSMDNMMSDCRKCDGITPQRRDSLANRHHDRFGTELPNSFNQTVAADSTKPTNQNS